MNDLFDKAIQLKNLLIARATGKSKEDDGDRYLELRNFFCGREDTKEIAPDFVKRCFTLDDFWTYIQPKYETYKERRRFIIGAFNPLLEYLESLSQNESLESMSEAIRSFDTDYIYLIWKKTIDRLARDPEGAITIARTMLEALCKDILDKNGIKYPNNVELPKLWSLVAEQYSLLPRQHDEKVFKVILGNCQAIINNIANVRNKMSDSHAQGRRAVNPSARHAKLVVNLAGTIATFLIETREACINH